jgi:hypothetical protein
MPLSDAAYQTLIVTQVGDTASGLIAAQIATLWSLNDDQPSRKLQYLHAKRAAIETLMGAVREQVTHQGEDNVRTQLSDKLKNLQIMLDAVDDDIDRYTASGVDTDSDFAAATGELTTTTSRPPPSLAGPDANDPSYRGDPYRLRRRR